MGIKGFPEELVDGQNKVINEQREQLKNRKQDLERKISIRQQYQVDLEAVEQFCQLVRKEIKDLSFEEKRLALEALQIKVLIDGTNIEITGAIPMLEDGVSLSTQSRLRGQITPSLFTFSIAV